jgi:hypothetical protein
MMGARMLLCTACELQVHGCMVLLPLFIPEESTVSIIYS